METSKAESTSEAALLQKSSVKKEAYLLLWDSGKEGFRSENAVTTKTIKRKIPTIFTREFKTILAVLSMSPREDL